MPTLERLLAPLARRPKALVAALAAVLGGFGVAAFGIAPLSPDATDLPRRMLTQSVEPEGLGSQLEALSALSLRLYRSDVTRASDTADSLLRRLGVDDADAAAFLRSDPIARRVLDGRAGKHVQAQLDEAGRLERLVVRYGAEREQAATHFTRLTVQRSGDALSSQVEVAPLVPQVRLGSGTIRSSLFAAIDEARLPDAVGTQLAEMFGSEIDFHRELRKGDTFSVLYEAMTADGEPVTWGPQAIGRVQAAEFVNDGRRHTAVWFKPTASAKGAYFGLDGKSKRSAFLASPLEFSRMTSGFAMRMHPILQQWRQHLGVDYSAPQGTPVRTVGDGVVEFAGWQNGYGNVIQVKHDNARSTRYAHLSRIDVHAGQHVEQGQRIGAVGATGWATGPHLHFEFRVGGEHRDPLSIAKAAEAARLGGSDTASFAQLVSGVRAQFDVAQSASRTGALAE